MGTPLGFGARHAQAGASYFYESLVWTGWPFGGGTTGASSLATGTTNLIAGIPMWNRDAAASTVATIEMAQATQEAGVNLTYTADPDNQIANNAQGQGDLGAARGGVRFMEAGARAVDSLAATLNNGTGAAVAGFQCNLGLSSRRLFAVEKLLAAQLGLQSSSGAYTLTQAETDALQSLGTLNGKGQVTATGEQQMAALAAKGSLPFALDEWLDRLIEARTVQVHDNMFKFTVDSATAQPFATYSASLHGTKGRFLVLESVAIEDNPNVVLQFNRDADTAWWSVNGAAFVQSDDAPWRVRLLARSMIQGLLAWGPGQTASVDAYVRLRVREVAMSDVMAVLLGIAKSPSQVPANTFNRAITGLF